MKTLFLTSLSLILSCVALAGEVSHSSPDPVSEAKALFERYAALEHAYDPAVADLYADTASNVG